MPTLESILALDFGQRRIGVAIASLAARLPRPLTTLQTGAHFLAELQKIIEDEAVTAIVVGLPRNLEGQPTDQTAAAQGFGHQLEQLGLPVHFQDEALTSQQAEAELKARGGHYPKEAVDALAATIILEDFLANNSKVTA